MSTSREELIASDKNKDQLLDALKQLGVVKGGEEGNAIEFEALDEAGIRTRMETAVAEWGSTLPVSDMTGQFGEAVKGVSSQVESAPDAGELSPERQATLDLLLGKRYQEGLDANLYTAESAPKAKVEAWLRADTTRLDWAKASEDRGGMPRFAGEEDGKWALAESSAEVPLDDPETRDICWGPNGAEYAFGTQGRSRNALEQAKKRGGSVIPKTLQAKLTNAGFIKNRNTWNHVADPSNRDLNLASMQTENKDYGLAWGAGSGGVFQDSARDHDDRGGLRCSLSGDKI